MNSTTIVQHSLGSPSTFVAGQILGLLCWTVAMALGWAAWRRRRGRDATDLLVAAGFWLAIRLILLTISRPMMEQPGSDWLIAALDLAGLVLLAWPFLAPPLPAHWADRLAGVGLGCVAPACGVALWQWVRGALGLPPIHPPAITWAHSALTLAGLAALNLLRRPTRRLGWILTAAGAFATGIGGLLIPLRGSPLLSSSLTPITAALAIALLNWLERSPREFAPAAPPSRRVSLAPSAWRPSHWLEASTALFAAPDLAQLLEAATAVLTHIVEIRLSGLFLTEDEEPLRLRLVARHPKPGEPGTYTSFSPNLVPLLADALVRRQIANVARESDTLLIEPLDRILGTRLDAALVLPLAEKQAVRGVLVLGRDDTVLDVYQLQLCSTVADQVAIAIGHMQLRFRIVQQARSLAHLIRRHQQETDRLLTILESIADGVIVSNANDEVILANSAALELLQVEMGDVLGRPFGQIVDRAVRAGDVGIMGMATEASPYSLEIVFEVAGRAVRTSMASIESSGGAQLGVVALMRDITAQVRAKAERDQQLADLQEQNQQLAEAAEHLQELVWAGKMELALSDTDLQELIEDAVTSVAPLIGDKPVTVVRALEFGLPSIRADKTRLRQVLLNLLTNAIKYTREGQIAVSASHGKGYVIVSVAHIGASVASHYVEAVYEGLGRAEDPSSRKMDGLRLSLSTSRRLIELHGGRIWVRKGRVLIIYLGLPIAGPPAAR